MPQHARLIQVAHELKEVTEQEITKPSLSRMRKLLSEATALVNTLGGISTQS